jgi:hypothetical protein
MGMGIGQGGYVNGVYIARQQLIGAVAGFAAILGNKSSTVSILREYAAASTLSGSAFKPCIKRCAIRPQPMMPHLIVIILSKS